MATHLQHFLDTFRRIVETPTGDAEIERMKDRWYREMDTARNRSRSVANCWLSPYFGVPVTLSQYQRAVKALRNDAEYQAFVEEKWFRDVQAVARQKRFFHWELEFPEAFFDAHALKPEEERGFDVVVGNPPYISSRNENFYSEARSYIDMVFKQAFYQVDLYYLFVELAHRLTKSHWSLITPDPWLGSVKTRAFRRWICASNRVLWIAYGSNIFEAGVDCIVIVCQKDKEGGEVPTVVDEFSTSGSVIASHVIRLPTDGSEIVISGTEKALDLIGKIISLSVPLGSIATTGRGIGAYHYSKHSQDIIKSRAYHSKYRKDETYLPELLGQHVRPYEIEWAGDNWISYGEWLSEPRDPIFFTGPRILCRKILGGRLFCTLTDDNWLVDQQIYIASAFERGYRAAYAATIVTSRLIGFFSRKRYHEEGLFPHLRVRQFRQLPIRRINFTVAPSDRERLFEECQEILQISAADERHDRVLEFVEQQLRYKPERADVVHDLLAFLAKQMVDMSKQKQEEINGFLKWLERYIGASVDDLKNKTRLRSYHDYDFQALLDVLRQNRRILKVDADSRNVQETVEREFNASMSKLNPLKSKIAATDRLIDLIVYRLYGLTEEEIEIVEDTMRC